MAARTVQLPEPTFRELNALKIRAASTLGSIPTNGDIIRFALKLANANFDDLIRELSDSNDAGSDGS